MWRKAPPGSNTQKLGALGIEHLATSGSDDRNELANGHRDNGHRDNGHPDKGQRGVLKWLLVALVSIIAVALVVGWYETPDPTTTPEIPEVAPTSTNPPIGRYQVAYISANGVTIVDPAAFGEPVRTLTPKYATVDDLLNGFDSWVMVDPRGKTYGLQIGTRRHDLTVYNLSSQWQISFNDNSIVAHEVGTTKGPTQIYVGPVAGVFMTPLDVPLGAALLAVPSLGVLVITESRETLVTTQSSLAHFSDWPVLAASANHHVEVRCVETPVCSLVIVDRATGNVYGVPTELIGEVGNVMISPDGNHLLLLDASKGAGNTDFLFDVAASELVALNETIPSAVAWSADSALAGWFDPTTNEPELRVLNVTTAKVETIDLSALGAPSRIGQSLLLLP